MLSLLALLLPIALVGFVMTETDDDDDGADEQTPDDQVQNTGTGNLLDEIDWAPTTNVSADGPTQSTDDAPEDFPEQPLTADGRPLFMGTDDPEGFILGEGNDVIFAKGGDDHAVGGPGDDSVFLGDGDDEGFRRSGIAQQGPPFGDEGDDLIRGGDGDDQIKDRQGADRLFGDLGNDILDSRDTIEDAAAADTIQGGFGRDLLIADTGDTVSGGAGDDVFAVASSEFDDAPVVITDYEPGEILAIELGDAAPEDVRAVQSDNGEEVEIRFKDEVIARIEDFTNPDDVRLVFMSELGDQYTFASPADEN